MIHGDIFEKRPDVFLYLVSNAKSDSVEVLVAGVTRTSDTRRPALEVLPNSLNVSLSDALRAIRALNQAALSLHVHVCATA